MDSLKKQIESKDTKITELINELERLSKSNKDMTEQLKSYKYDLKVSNQIKKDFEVLKSEYELLQKSLKEKKATFSTPPKSNSKDIYSAGNSGIFENKNLSPNRLITLKQDESTKREIKLRDLEVVFSLISR